MHEGRETEQVYYDQPYLTELNSQVIGIEPRGNQHIVTVHGTVFFPEGGGQPCDRGEIIGAVGTLRVEQVRMIADGCVAHQGKLTGQLIPGEQVRGVLNWAARYRNMRVHSAGHLVHDVLMTLTSDLIPTKGNHGPKAYLEYAGQLDPALQELLEDKVNEAVSRDLLVITRDTTSEELSTLCRFVPPGLPREKRLRLIQVGDFDPMPDGGVHVRSTKEIGAVAIYSITSTSNQVTIRYGLKS